jgi:hypothetical protein
MGGNVESDKLDLCGFGELPISHKLLLKSGSGSAGEKFIFGQVSRRCTTLNLHMLQHDVATLLHPSE